MTPRHLFLLAPLLLAVGALATPLDAGAAKRTHRIIVFNAEGNRLNAYAPGRRFHKQIVIPSQADSPRYGLDINAQICFKPGSRQFIAGEDTNQNKGRPQGWGYFQLRGSRVGDLSAKEIGRLVPTYQPDQDNPENYGCGFLRDGRMFTTDVGAQQPNQPANGQLIIWFPPLDRFRIPYCKIDISIPTAGGIHVDRKTHRVYVASNRPGPDRTGGIYRYNPPYPTSNKPSGGCDSKDGTGAPMTTTVDREPFILSDQHVSTPSAITPSGRGTYYVSSVFTGVIAEYDKTGAFVREILRPPPSDVTPPYDSGTPFGLGVDSHKRLYYADLGIGPGPPPGPENKAGSVRQIRFKNGNPRPPVMMEDKLDFPDGIGVLEFNVRPSRRASRPTPAGAIAASFLIASAAAFVRRNTRAP